MESVLHFLSNNKVVLPIVFIAFIVQFKGLVYLMQNLKYDFSYSGHKYTYYEGTLGKTILAILACALGITTILGCCLYININQKVKIKIIQIQNDIY